MDKRRDFILEAESVSIQISGDKDWASMHWKSKQLDRALGSDSLVVMLTKLERFFEQEFAHLEQRWHMIIALSPHRYVVYARPRGQGLELMIQDGHEVRDMAYAYLPDDEIKSWSSQIRQAASDISSHSEL